MSMTPEKAMQLAEMNEQITKLQADLFRQNLQKEFDKQSEFTDFEEYFAFKKAVRDGLVKPFVSRTPADMTPPAKTEPTPPAAKAFNRDRVIPVGVDRVSFSNTKLTVR